ncbi:MAG: AAA family ATPase [Chromatiales bacterium]|nr:AAA family ATPase [Chromatiales bacterium]
MIERIVIENFKSLRKVDLSLGRVNLFIGTNASGKSNFLEALRVLEGIGNGFTINEILNGKPKTSASGVWEGIRGGSAHACLADSDDAGEIAIKVYGKWDDMRKLSRPEGWEYYVSFSPDDRGKVTDEYIVENTSRYRRGDLPEDLLQNPSQPMLGMVPEIRLRRHGVRMGDLPETEFSFRLHEFAYLLRAMQRIDLVPEVLRGYSQFKRTARMGDHGENFAALVNRICDEEHTKDAYLSWLRELRPEQIDDAGTLSGAVGEPMFMLQENGRTFPAPVLSEGTLRFAALTAAFFQDRMPGIITIEDIENGIHASRVQHLLELMRSRAEYRQIQVLATTHSATILDWLREEDYKTTFLCRRDEATGESRICSLADVPHFMDAVRKTPASELFAEGWMEMAP